VTEGAAAVNKCLFPVAGHGTGFLPISKVIPGEMLPVLDRPLLHYGVEEALAAGLGQIALVTGHGKQVIEDYFDINPVVEGWARGTAGEHRLDALNALIQRCDFASAHQQEARGLGDAVLSGRHLIEEQPFGVILVDDLCITGGAGVMAQMMEVYRRRRCSVVAVAEVAPEAVGRYGIIAGEAESEGLYRVTGLAEKPAPGDAPSSLAVIGRYILTPDIFGILGGMPAGENGCLQLTDALDAQARTGEVLAMKYSGRRFDCSHTRGLIDAANYLLEHGSSLG